MYLIRSTAGICLIYAVVLATQEDILLITMDTTRADHLSCYGYGLKTTPFLDEFAEGAAVFTRAYTPAPYTVPAHATLLTGLWPKDHGVRDNIITPLKPSIPSVAALLQKRGYRTAAIVSSFVLDRPIPEAIDRTIAALKLKSMGIAIDELTDEQKRYLESWQEGT